MIASFPNGWILIILSDHVVGWEVPQYIVLTAYIRHSAVIIIVPLRNYLLALLFQITGIVDIRWWVWHPWLVVWIVHIKLPWWAHSPVIIIIIGVFQQILTLILRKYCLRWLYTPVPLRKQIVFDYVLCAAREWALRIVFGVSCYDIVVAHLKLRRTCLARKRVSALRDSLVVRPVAHFTLDLHFNFVKRIPQYFLLIHFWQNRQNPRQLLVAVPIQQPLLQLDGLDPDFKLLLL